MRPQIYKKKIISQTKNYIRYTLEWIELPTTNTTSEISICVNDSHTANSGTSATSSTSSSLISDNVQTKKLAARNASQKHRDKVTGGMYQLVYLPC